MISFQNRHVVLPVIHIEQMSEMLENAEIAQAAGCDGVFLINHSGGYQKLDEYYGALRKEMPDWWIGINALDIHQTVLFDEIRNGGKFPGVNGIWADDAEIHDGNKEQPRAENNLEAKSDLDLLYFGGVAFKYVHGPWFDATGAALVAKDLLDVVVTSGPGTGKEADPHKVESMAEACNPTPLGIASGLTPQNVQKYLPYAKFLLVATGVSDTWTKFNPDVLKYFVDQVRSWDQ